MIIFIFESIMKIEKLILENFRGYQTRTEILFNQFTALIGKNDAGKSSVLEALDIFFENSKPDQGDACIYSERGETRIGVVFNSVPSEMNLDRGARSSLKAEYLLNTDGNFEIHKIYNLNVQRPTSPKIFAVCNHPKNKSIEGLLQKNNAQLKQLVRERNLTENCNLNENPSMRQAIYNAVDNLELETSEIPLNDENGKAVWAALQTRLPMYALFRSDRASSDQDPEVQNPMKAAVHKALSELQDELKKVTEEVHKRVEETANRTMEQLQSTYPDLAKSLTPQFKAPSWQNVFKVDLESDDGVPLNKRGSGVRRLVLMSFFQAEAEKKRRENADQDFDGSVPVIYAIEEPETSQHPDNQLQIVQALQEVASTGDQVIITTHVPGLAELIPLDGLRYLDRHPDTDFRRIRHGNTDVYEEIANALGVLPDPIKVEGIKVAVLVEGKTDVDALRSISLVLSEAGEFDGLDEDRIFWALGGGETLKDWVERNYLGNLKVPQVVLFDSDRTAENLAAHKDKQMRLRDINAWRDRTGFMTKKREIENYIDIDELQILAENKLTFPDEFNPDYSDMPNIFARVIRDAIDNRGLEFRPFDHAGNPIRATKRYSKHILTSYVLRKMSADKLKERSHYNIDGEDRYEVLDWLQAINDYCQD